MSNHRGWYKPRSLPHLDAPILQSVTFRTADSIPVEVIARIQESLVHLEERERQRAHIRRFENQLDSHLGECRLKDRRVAEIIQQLLLDGDGTRYRLHAWVVMPTHVRVLFRPLNAMLSDIMQRWKGASARAINEIDHREGKFWAKDYFDRGIRDQDHFDRVFEYIENNPVRAGLCKRPDDWPYGIAGTGLGRCGIVDAG